MNARYSDLLKNIEPSKFFNIMHEIESISLAKFDVPFMYVDYLYRGKNEILLVKYFLSSEEERELSWLADERADGEIPLYFSEESYFESPAYFLYRSKKLIEDCVYQGKTYPIHMLLVCNNDIVNYEDMLPIWNDMGITVVHQCGMDVAPVELSSTFYLQPDGSRVEFLREEELNSEMQGFYHEFVLKLALSHDEVEKDFYETPLSEFQEVSDDDFDDDFDDNVPELPEHYTDCFNLLGFALYRMNQPYMNYSEVISNNVSLNLFNQENLCKILLLLQAKNLLDVEYRFPFNIRLSDESGNEIMTDHADSCIVGLDENQVIQLIYELEVASWEKGMYLVEVKFRDEVVVFTTFEIGDKDIEGKYGIHAIQPKTNIAARRC